MTGLLIISIIVLALTLIIITKHKRFLESYYQELLQALQESQTVKSELENLMNQAVQLSTEMVSKLEHSGIDFNLPAYEQRINDQSLGAAAADNDSEIRQDSQLNIEAADKYCPQTEENSLELPILYQQVVSLYEQGYAIKDIASQLNRGQGEISLILNITNKLRVI